MPYVIACGALMYPPTNTLPLRLPTRRRRVHGAIKRAIQRDIKRDILLFGLSARAFRLPQQSPATCPPTEGGTGCIMTYSPWSRPWEVAKKLPSYILPSSPVPADAAQDIADAFVRDALRRHLLRDHDGDPMPDPKCPGCQKLSPKSQPLPKPENPPKSDE